MLRAVLCSILSLLLIVACASSGTLPAKSRDAALAQHREHAAKAGARIAAGEDAVAVVQSLRAELERDPSIVDVASIVVSDSGRSIAFRTAGEGLPLAFFANRHLPSNPAYVPQPLALPASTTPPPGPLTLLVLDPESTRPKLGINFATSGADIEALFRSAGHPSEAITRRAGTLTLADYDKIPTVDVLYFQGDGDRFAGFSAVVSGIEAGPDPVATHGIQLGAALADQRAMLTMEGDEIVLTHRFFAALPKTPRIAFMNGFPAGTPDHFAETMTARGTEHYLASLVPRWDVDVDYLAFRVFEELLAGHDLRKVHELSSSIGPTLSYLGPGFLFVGCGPECRLSCVELLGACMQDDVAGGELCDRIGDNGTEVRPTRGPGDDAPAMTEEGEGAKKHVLHDGPRYSISFGLTTPPPEPGCTKLQMDNELASFRGAYLYYAGTLGENFRGCLDITQDLHFVFQRIKPPITCWTAGIAWRLTVLQNPLFCVSNFMHNAFLMTPQTNQFGHVPTVFDPYEFWDNRRHTPRIQTMPEFVMNATHGGADHGLSNITRSGEKRRMQHTIDANVDSPDCKDLVACLREEFPDLIDNCK